MDKLKVSPKFTIEDIHAIRINNYERRKNMTNDELRADIDNNAKEVLAEIEKRQKIKHVG
jgi:hypothetical protein